VRQGPLSCSFPLPPFWWLEFYADFRQHLERRYRRVRADADCVIYALATEREDVAIRQPLEALAAEVQGIARREADLRASWPSFRNSFGKGTNNFGRRCITPR